MVSWWVPNLAKGPRPDLNNGPEDNSNCDHIYGPRHLFESNLNNVPSTGHKYVPLMVSWWVQYLAKGPRPDFTDNGPGITRIVASFLPPRRLFESSSNNGLSPGQSNLGQIQDTSVQVSHLWSPGGCKGPRPDFNNGPGVNSNSGLIFPQRLFESNSNNGPSPDHSNLGTLKTITTACTVAVLLISLFSRQNAKRRALSELKVLTKIV